MFTKKLLKRNKPLIDFVLHEHKKGLLEPDTYFLDLDTIKDNAKLLFANAKKNNMEIFQMTKQFGRNYLIAQEIAKQGITDVVAVDWKEAEILYKHGLQIGNIGHVVQVPRSKVASILKMKPKYWTIYSLDILKHLDFEAKKQEVIQQIIIRVYKTEQDLYPSQKGGININDLHHFLEQAQKLKSIKIVGLTSFPCILFEQESNQFKLTENFDAVLQAKKILTNHHIEVFHINVPSANCLKTIDMIVQKGGNAIEPGHALTGTIPLIDEYEHKEIPSMLYYSQVSHIFENKIIGFAGGHYRRSKMKGALIGSNLSYFENIPLDPEVIDYYFEFKNNNNYKVQIGDSIISLFRTQIFMTRSKVKIVKGLKNGDPTVIGTFDSQGRNINE